MEILVVDDDEDALESVAELCEVLGHEVFSSRSAEEALDVYDKRRFSMVLMDLKMPGMGGAEGTRQILEVDPDASIVIITGNTVREEVEEVQRLRIKALLRKPVDPNDLVRLIDVTAA